VNSANSGDADIRNLTVTLIRTVVLQRSWYQMPGCSVQWKMNTNTHGYMTVWYTKGIYVSFVNCFVVLLPHPKTFYCWHNLGTVWLVFYCWISKLINVSLSPSFPNSLLCRFLSAFLKIYWQISMCDFGFFPNERSKNHPPTKRN
jgi:hypothetical protein